MFTHERLLAYQRALTFHRHVVELKPQLPRGLADLYDQLHRASSSLCLNLAEGANALAPGDKRRYFRIALASAGECAAALDLFAIERDKRTAVNPRARTALDETAALTVGLIRRL